MRRRRTRPATTRVRAQTTGTVRDGTAANGGTRHRGMMPARTAHRRAAVQVPPTRHPDRPPVRIRPSTVREPPAEGRSTEGPNHGRPEPPTVRTRDASNTQGPNTGRAKRKFGNPKPNRSPVPLSAANGHGRAQTDEQPDRTGTTAQTPAPSTELIWLGSPHTISRAPARPSACGSTAATASSAPPLTATTTTGRAAARDTSAESA